MTGYVAGVADSGPTPEGLEVVDVGFHVMPGDDHASELLEQLCRFRAVDGDERSWEPSTAFSFWDTSGLDSGSISTGCLGPGSEAIPPGSDQLLRVTFLVPADVVGKLRFEVRVATETDREAQRPEALAFETQELAPND